MSVLVLNEMLLKFIGVIEFNLLGIPVHLIIVGLYLISGSLVHYGSAMYARTNASDLNKSATAIYVLIAMTVSIGSHVSIVPKMRKIRKFLDDIRSLVNESKSIIIINTKNHLITQNLLEKYLSELVNFCSHFFNQYVFII